MDRAVAAWDYAVALYARPGVREACLALQDRRGADAIAVLALVHRAAAGGTAPAEGRLKDALAQVAPWRERTVLPLRAMRRALKGWRFAGTRFDAEAEATRQAIANAELSAERVQLSVMADLLAADVAPAKNCDALSVAAGSLGAYWRLAGLDCDAEDRSAVAALLSSAFADRTRDAARAVAAAFNF